MRTVLVVEDDLALRHALRVSLQSWEFRVLEAESGEAALSIVTADHPDLVILDLSLPGIDGIETLRHLRSFTPVPVVVLTVRDSLGDKVTALEAGADDYMVKPFESEELIARARAHLRRAPSAAPQDPVVRSAALSIDLAQSLVTWDGERVALTRTEWRLLEVLLEHRGKLVTRERLLEALWGSRHRSDQARLRIAVLHLRRKLHDDAARPQLIFTEPGLGYRWIAPHEERDEPSP